MLSVGQTNFQPEEKPDVLLLNPNVCPQTSPKERTVFIRVPDCVVGQDAEGKAEHVGPHSKCCSELRGRPGMLVGNAKGYFVSTDRGSV